MPSNTRAPRTMGGLAASKLSAKAYVLQRYPDANTDRWPRVDRRVRVLSGGITLGIADTALGAWGDAARRLRTSE